MLSPLWTAHGLFAAVPGAPRWQALPELPRAISGQFVGVSGGALLVAGGSYFPMPLFEGGKKVWVDTVSVLEPGARAWRAATPLPRPLGYGGSVSTPEGLICLGGGDADANSAEVFRLTWANGRLERVPLPPLPCACAMMGAARLGDVIYVAGGQETPASTEALCTLWALDLSRPEPAWEVLPGWPGPARILPVVAAQDGALSVISGCELSAGPDGKAVRRYLKDAYRYRPGDGWEGIPGPPRPVTAAPCLAWGKTRVLVFGGDDGENAQRVWELKEKHPGFSRQVLSLDTRAGAWSVFAPYAAGLVTTCAAPWQGGIAVPGGEDRPGHRVAQVPLLLPPGEPR